MRDLRDADVLRADIGEMARAAAKVMGDRYVGRINSVLSARHNEALANPSREARLLAAMKPFFDEERQKGIDGALQTLAALETLMALKTSEPAPERPFTAASAEGVQPNFQQDESVHGDGVYDLDGACLLEKKNRSRAGFALLIAVMAMMR